LGTHLERHQCICTHESNQSESVSYYDIVLKIKSLFIKQLYWWNLSMSGNETIKNVLQKHKIVAVVGLSRNSAKDSYQVAEYLKSKSYDIIPLNPFADEILGK